MKPVDEQKATTPAPGQEDEPSEAPAPTAQKDESLQLLEALCDFGGDSYDLPSGSYDYDYEGGMLPGFAPNYGMGSQFGFDSEFAPGKFPHV